MVVCDEAVSALDVSIQAQIVTLIRDLQAETGLALIFISHDLAVVRQLAHRVMVLYLGRVVEMADAETLYRDPRHPYTMALLRSVPRLDRPRQARLDPVEGQPPDLTRLDDGCSFRPRCRFAVAACAASRPTLEQAGAADHLSACFRRDEISATPVAA